MYEPYSQSAAVEVTNDPIRMVRIDEGRSIAGRRRESQATRTKPVRRTSAQSINKAPPTAVPALMNSAATATLDKLNRGVLLIRSDGGIAFMNRAARAMFARQDGLGAPGGRLEFLQRSVQVRFDEFLRRRADADGEASLVLVAGGPRQRGAYRVLVSPLDVGVELEGPSNCVFIYEPAAGRRELPQRVLAQIYGLTPGEARLTNQLFVGKSLQAAATALGITANTARSKLKRIFSKCSVGSQAELLQLLSLGPRTL